MPQTAPQRSRQPQPSQSASRAQPAEQTEDHEYALVSVLYHALQGVQACDQYIEDAERAGDEELQQFFQEAREEQTALANRAKQLLISRVDEDEEDEDEDQDDEEDDEES
jgi:hypothetical protein